MHHRRPPLALLIRHRRPAAGLVPAHMLPEFFEVVRGSHAFQPGFNLLRQGVVGSMHVGELGPAQRLAGAAGDADAVQHVHKSNRFPIRHVGVPVLPGVGAANILAIFLDVRQDADLRERLCRINRTDRIALDFPEQFGKSFHIADIKMLIRKPQHAVLAQRQQDAAEIRFRNRLGKIDPTNRRTQDCASRFDRQHRQALPLYGFMNNKASATVRPEPSSCTMTGFNSNSRT